MRILVKTLTVIAIFGLIAGVIVAVLGEVLIAALIWAVTATISFLGYDISRSKKENL